MNPLFVKFFPKVDDLFLELDSTVYNISVRDNQSGQTLLKTVTRGRYRKDSIIMMQFSGTCSPKIKQRVRTCLLPRLITLTYRFRCSGITCDTVPYHSVYISASHVRLDLDGYCSHFNIARFVGGSNPSASESYPFVLLREGNVVICSYSEHQRLNM